MFSIPTGKWNTLYPSSKLELKKATDTYIINF